MLFGWLGFLLSACVGSTRTKFGKIRVAPREIGLNSSISSLPGRCAENSRIAWEASLGLVRVHKHGGREAQSEAHSFWGNGTNRPAVSAASFGPRTPRDSRGQDSRESDNSVSTHMDNKLCTAWCQVSVDVRYSFMQLGYTWSSDVPFVHKKKTTGRAQRQHIKLRKKQCDISRCTTSLWDWKARGLRTGGEGGAQRERCLMPCFHMITSIVLIALIARQKVGQSGRSFWSEVFPYDRKDRPDRQSHCDHSEMSLDKTRQDDDFICTLVYKNILFLVW